MNLYLWQQMSQYSEIREILQNKKFIELDDYNHHFTVTRRAHCLDVASLVFSLSMRSGLDFISATRGALLHDFFFYNWRTEGPRLHGFRHPAIALRTAAEYFNLNPIEEDAILRHMWPLTPIPPRYPESAIVSMADKMIALGDYAKNINYLSFYRMAMRRAKI